MEEGRMKLTGASLFALAVALLLAALSLVAWRQARSLDRLAELAELEAGISLLTAERSELEGRVQLLQSRGRVVPAAREDLGMRAPRDEAGEIVLLTAAESGAP
jgi:cell division protein FtsB